MEISIKIQIVKFYARLIDPVKDEKGIALVLVLIMLTLLSLLGTMSLDTTRTEVAISSNVMDSQEAFYAAIRASDVAETDETIYTSIGSGMLNLGDSPARVNLIEQNIWDAKDLANINQESRLTRATLYTPPTGEEYYETSSVGGVGSYVPAEPNRIEFLTTGALPPDSGSDPSIFQARYYHISVQTQMPDPVNVDPGTGLPLPLEVVRVESRVARIVPK